MLSIKISVCSHYIEDEDYYLLQFADTGTICCKITETAQRIFKIWKIKSQEFILFIQAAKLKIFLSFIIYYTILYTY